MAIRFSPGCGCCLGKCVETTLQWIPSSPYDRGEYTDDDRWRPFTEYLQGDQFWEFALDRNGDTHKFLFTAPATMMSGGGWTLTEEARYNRGRGISYADGLQDFELFGSGWARDQIRLHEALQTQRLAERQGIVSRRELAKDEWIANWKVDVKSTVEYDDMEMESLSIRVKFMGSVEYDSEVDDLPTSGIVTVVSKAKPDERVIGPYPVECIPICATEVGEIFDPDNPQCGPNPPFRPEFKVEHGTFSGASEDLDDTYAKKQDIVSLTNCRSVQPESAAVMGSLDVPNQGMFGGREEGEPLDLHNFRVLNECFGGRYTGGNAGAGFSDGFEEHRLQNAVAVITEGGMVTQGGSPFMVQTGDIIQITDFTKLDCDPFADQHFRGTADFPEDGAFTHIPAAEIVEHDRTCYLDHQTREGMGIISVLDNDIDVARNLSAYTGGKLAVYVEKFSDLDIDRTRSGEYYCLFDFNMCRLSSPATITLPQCEPIPAYECDCRPMRVTLVGADLTNPALYDFCHLEQMMQGVVPASSDTDALTGVTYTITPIEGSGGLEWLGPGRVPGGLPNVSLRYNDCDRRAANFAIAQSWTLYALTQSSGFFGRAPAPTYQWRVQTTGVVETSRFHLFDCIGQRDKVVLARSAVFMFSGSSASADQLGAEFGTGRIITDIDGDGNIDDWGDLVYYDLELARDAMNKAKLDDLNAVAHTANMQLCNSQGLGFDMKFGGFTVPGFGRDLGNLEDVDRDGDIDIAPAPIQSDFIAASLHAWSLEKDVGRGCAYAVTVRYPTWDEQENQQRAGRHFSPIATCSLETPATSFAGQTSTIASR